MMSALRNYSQPLDGRPILLSVQPRFASQFLAGTKRIEFRRRWAAERVRMFALYSTAPVQRIIGIAAVAKVIEAAPSKLWHYSTEFGGGLTRRELMKYFEGRPKGFAILVENFEHLRTPLDPLRLFNDFRAPQSFRYLTPSEFKTLSKKFQPSNC